MNISKELIVIRELLGITQEELARKIGVSFETINRWENSKNDVELRNVNIVYNFAYEHKIYINSIYEQLFIEEYQQNNSKILFHGSKNSEFKFPIDFVHSKINNDFGIGFYLGETYKQAVTYIANGNASMIYSFKLDLSDLNVMQFVVNKEWMIAIAYYRGWINQYSNNEFLKSIISKVNESDVIIAPIADNRMFDIISEFVRGEITDLQCEHALAATNLGYQYVIKTEKALKNISLVKSLYVCELEKEKLRNLRLEMSEFSQDKVRVARIEYRGKGHYIDEMLK